MDDRTVTAGDVSAEPSTAGASPEDVTAETCGTVDARGAEPLPPAPLPVVDAAHYEVGGEHARGGLGRILRGRDRRLVRPVAIKELLRETRESRARFVREARITARLQHPGVVPIYEAGTWPTGQPFYAMKLVAGQPLSAIIADRPALADRLALLPKVLAVAETMAYAHAQRIIHRDLKPSNVLVGDYGETVVIDWGLAKDLDGPDDSSSGASDDGGDPTLTAAGSVLGTPAYMAPEQARGEMVDARADVYAIGAMLYHLLAGAPPYGSSRQARVADGPPPALPEIAPEVPEDLAAIVAKAMARDVADRYPTARDLAADLDRFTRGRLVAAHRYGLGERLLRYTRRHRAVVTVAAVAALALVLTVALSLRRIVAERDVAEAERARAIAQRRAAESLVDYMLGEQHRGLAALGKLDLLEGVGQRVAAYYDELVALGRDPESRRRRARALGVLGDAARTRGRLDEAATHFRGALAEWSALGAIPDLARTQIELGRTAFEGGDAAAALVAATQAQVLVTSLATAAPGDPALRRDLARVLDLLGDTAARRGEVERALDANQRSLALFEALPDELRDEGDILGVRAAVADLELQSGNSARAAALYRDVAAAHARRAAAAPDDTSLQRDYVVGLQRSGDASWAAGHHAAALDDFRAGRVAAQRLVDHEPANTAWQNLLMLAYKKEGRAVKDRGDLDAAGVAFDAAVAIAQRMVDRDPGSAQWLFELAHARFDAGNHAETRNDFAGARAAYEAGLEAARRAVAGDPRNARFRLALGGAHTELGDIATLTGDQAAAIESYRAAAAIWNQYVVDNPKDMVRRTFVASIHRRTAAAYAKTKDFAGCLSSARQAVEHAEIAVAADPDLAAAVEGMGKSRAQLARCLLRAGATAEGKAAHDRALEELTRLETAGTLSRDGIDAIAALRGERRSMRELR